MLADKVNEKQLYILLLAAAALSSADNASSSHSKLWRALKQYTFSVGPEQHDLLSLHCRQYCVAHWSLLFQHVMCAAAGRNLQFACSILYAELNDAKKINQHVLFFYVSSKQQLALAPLHNSTVWELLHDSTKPLKQTSASFCSIAEQLWLSNSFSVVFRLFYFAIHSTPRPMICSWNAAKLFSAFVSTVAVPLHSEAKLAIL
jgi:hypothetical protein